MSRNIIWFVAYFQANPKAAMSLSPEVDPNKKIGSMQYVALSDIKSGKVKLPDSSSSDSDSSSSGSSSPTRGKGFAAPISPTINSENELQ